MSVQNGHVLQAPGEGNPHTPAEGSISEIRLPLVALGLLRASEAVAWTSIFPYVYPMIKSFPGVDETDIPLYAGLLVAVFTFCEFLSGILWAKLSDRIGRKSTLLVGPLCGIVASVSLGLSHSLVLALVSRAFGGLFNPNVGLVQTCAVELAKRKEQRAKALSFVTFLRSMGNLVGPVIGGFLADPVAHYPSLYPPGSLWATHPFLLPNLAVALFQTISFVVAFLSLPETYPQLSDQQDLGLRIGKALAVFLRCRVSQERGQYRALQRELAGVNPPGLVGGGADGTEEFAHELQDMSSEKGEAEPQIDASSEYKPKNAFTFQVIFQIISVSLLAFHKVSSDAIIPTFLAAPTSSTGHPATRRDFFETPGGFGYSNREVGIILLSQAVVALATQATLVPFIIDKMGVIRAYCIVLGLYPSMYILTPLLPKLPPVLSLVLLLLDLWIKVVLSSIGYICSAILIASVTPCQGHLARVNGASASLACLSRSLGPVVTGKIFSVGLEWGYAGIAFWTLGAVALLGMVESIVLREHP